MNPHTVRQWRVLGLTALVMVPYFSLVEWLKAQADYPESFGITFHSRRLGGLIEEMSHSGLLYDRGSTWDLTLLAAMWPGLIASCVFLFWLIRRDDRLEALEKGGQ